MLNAVQFFTHCYFKTILLRYFNGVTRFMDIPVSKVITSVLYAQTRAYLYNISFPWRVCFVSLTRRDISKTTAGVDALIIDAKSTGNITGLQCCCDTHTFTPS